MWDSLNDRQVICTRCARRRQFIWFALKKLKIDPLNFFFFMFSLGMAKRTGPPRLSPPRLSLLKTGRDEPNQIRWLSPKSHHVPLCFLREQRTIFLMHLFYNLIVTKNYVAFIYSFKNRTGDRLDKGTGSLSHWSNHWVTGWTAWVNRIESDDSVI